MTFLVLLVISSFRLVKPFHWLSKRLHLWNVLLYFSFIISFIFLRINSFFSTLEDSLLFNHSLNLLSLYIFLDEGEKTRAKVEGKVTTLYLHDSINFYKQIQSVFAFLAFVCILFNFRRIQMTDFTHFK